LLTALKTDSISFRLACADSLVRIDRQQIPSAVAPLVTVLQNGTAVEQQRALMLLKSYGSQAKPAVPALLDLLKTEKLAVRISISDTLIAIDAGQSDAALPALIEALQAKQDPYGLQRNAVRMLTKLGSKAKSAAPALKEMLKDAMNGRSINPYLVIECLKKVEASAEIMPILIEGLNSAERNTREEVLYLLEDVYGASALAALDAAVANGQLRETPELVNLMKHLRPRAAGVNQ
jgi:HEAT repeat protein